jgi:transcriptional regulator with XRE-family HTH domain
VSITNQTPGPGRALLGQVIRAYREQAGLSQRQLAAMAGLHHSLLARIENGEVERPSAELLQHLSDTLEIDASELLSFIGVRPSLPEPRAYFRRAYGLSDTQAREAARLIEQRYGRMPTKQARADATKETN